MRAIGCLFESQIGIGIGIGVCSNRDSDCKTRTKMAIAQQLQSIEQRTNDVMCFLFSSLNPYPNRIQVPTISSFSNKHLILSNSICRKEKRVNFTSFRYNYKAERLCLFPSIPFHLGFVFAHPEVGSVVERSNASLLPYLQCSGLLPRRCQPFSLSSLQYLARPCDRESAISKLASSGKY